MLLLWWWWWCLLQFLVMLVANLGHLIVRPDGHLIRASVGRRGCRGPGEGDADDQQDEHERDDRADEGDEEAGGAGRGSCAR